MRLTAFAREVVPPEVVLVAGANTESTRGTIREAKRLAAEGAELLLVHTPVYFAPALSHATVLEFFRAVAGESPVPVLIYHMPKFTHVTIEAGLMAELVRLPNVVGFKDSSGDVQRFADYTRLCREDARMLVGSGALFYTALELGAVGGILAIGDLHAARCADVYRAFRDGDTRRAGELQSGLTTLHKDIVAPFGARGIKTALDAMGWAGGPPRPPLVPLTDKEEKQVLRTLAETGLAAVA